MGKDQDLLDAARCGNISIVERLLNQRAKKTGPLSSLRLRGPGPNVQDSSGYTPLHHAALNGHIDIVMLLLNHAALSNLVDNKGCTPLHLASWSGNTEIVNLLLTHNESVPDVNHMNFDHESALHSAAQYGHTKICKLLIEHNCYPSVRNIRNESPLDLASQYGRLETVQALLQLHPALLNDLIRCHSPLHLASKNGHKSVVKVLLNSGFNVNFMTDVGTALHEAAMYGKIEVVKILLEYGIDINLENSRKRTVFHILRDLNTTIASQIEDVIRDHMTLIKLDSGSSDSVSSVLPPLGFVTGLQIVSLQQDNEVSLSDIVPPLQFCSSLDKSLYDIPPPPKLYKHSSRSNESLSLPGFQDSSFDRTSCSSCSLKRDPKDSAIYENVSFCSENHEKLLYAIPSPPTLFSTKRYSDPSDQSRFYQNICLPSICDKKDKQCDSCTLRSSLILQNRNMPRAEAEIFPCNNCTQPPAKPPRKSTKCNTPNHKHEYLSSKTGQNNYEFLFLANSGERNLPPRKEDTNINKMATEASVYSNSCIRSDYSGMNLQSNIIANSEVIYSNGTNHKKPNYNTETKLNSSCNKFSEVLPMPSKYENLQSKINSFNNLMPSKSSPALHASRHMLDHMMPFPHDKDIQVLKPGYLNSKQKRASIQIPTSPTNYQQPPTPDIPPPSPATAETGIHEKICPIKKKECKHKRSIVRDIDTLTDEQLVATIDPCGEIQLTLATDNKCIETENLDSDCLFAGLCHGSIAQSTGPQVALKLPVPYSSFQIPLHPCTTAKIYESVNVIMESGHKKLVLPESTDANVLNTNHNSLSVMSPFDEKAEWAEIADIMASFGGRITRESVFVQNIESSFTQSFMAGLPNNCTADIVGSITQWLASLSLSQYENLLIINGFDDIRFLGGNIIEDQDLEEIGIVNKDHRQKFCAASQRLPTIQPLNRCEKSAFPLSVDDWLHSINLLEYSENFSNNNITDMERASKLWEVELSTVLKITKVGHRKRILASLGDKHFERFDNSAIDLSKLNLDLSELGIDDSTENNCVEAHASMPLSEGGKNGPRKYLRIRPPTQLMSNLPCRPDTLQNIEAQWRHHPNDLIKDSCSYMAKYLGSTLVKELKGMESTKKSIQKLRSSSYHIGKIPDIILSISYSGVKFIDAETRQLVCEHEIRNIHCACQDADDLCLFAYITKDHQTHNHYCHVFSSNNVDLASEIILTLGQAFEVAFQISVHEKSGEDNHLLNNFSFQLLNHQSKYPNLHVCTS